MKILWPCFFYFFICYIVIHVKCLGQVDISDTTCVANTAKYMNMIYFSYSNAYTDTKMKEFFATLNSVHVDRVKYIVERMFRRLEFGAFQHTNLHTRNFCGKYGEEPGAEICHCPKYTYLKATDQRLGQRWSGTVQGLDPITPYPNEKSCALRTLSKCLFNFDLVPTRTHMYDVTVVVLLSDREPYYNETGNTDTLVVADHFARNMKERRINLGVITTKEAYYGWLIALDTLKIEGSTVTILDPNYFADTLVEITRRIICSKYSSYSSALFSYVVKDKVGYLDLDTQDFLKKYHIAFSLHTNTFSEQLASKLSFLTEKNERLVSFVEALKSRYPGATIAYPTDFGTKCSIYTRNSSESMGVNFRNSYMNKTDTMYLTKELVERYERCHDELSTHGKRIHVMLMFGYLFPDDMPDELSVKNKLLQFYRYCHETDTSIIFIANTTPEKEVPYEDQALFDFKWLRVSKYEHVVHFVAALFKSIDQRIYRFVQPLNDIRYEPAALPLRISSLPRAINVFFLLPPTAHTFLRRYAIQEFDYSFGNRIMEELKTCFPGSRASFGWGTYPESGLYGGYLTSKCDVRTEMHNINQQVVVSSWAPTKSTFKKSVPTPLIDILLCLKTEDLLESQWEPEARKYLFVLSDKIPLWGEWEKTKDDSDPSLPSSLDIWVEVKELIKYLDSKSIKLIVLVTENVYSSWMPNIIDETNILVLPLSKSKSIEFYVTRGILFSE